MSLFNSSLMDKITNVWIGASLGVESALNSVSPRGTRAAGYNDNEDKSYSSINKAANIIEAEKASNEAPVEPAGEEKIDDSSYVTDSVDVASQDHEKFILLNDKEDNTERGIFGIEVIKNPNSTLDNHTHQQCQCEHPTVNQIQATPVGNYGDIDMAISIAEQISANTGNPVLDVLKNKEVMNAAAKQLQEYQYKLQLANAVHKKDEPPKVIQKKSAPVETADVQVSNIDIAGTFVDHEEEKYKQKREPEVISNKIDTKTSITKPIAEPFYNNSEITSKYPYMKDIELAALKENVQLMMRHLPNIQNPELPSGIISCYAYTDGIPNVYKSFTIDTGVIIDRRVKMYPALVENGAIIDTMQAYPVCIESRDSKNKNKSSAFNEELFYNLFTGGISNMPRNGMYRGYQELNRYVDIISLPTKDLNHDDRKKIMDRLMASMKCGVFKTALEMSPNSRFRFIPATLNKKKTTFSLTNEGVPLYYNSIPQSGRAVRIDFGPDNNTNVKAM